MTDFEPIKLYVDIDALLDTRLATLYRLNHSLAHEALANGYYGRLCDEFHGYDVKAYHEAYANRDEKTLSLAMMTEVIDFIRYFAERTLKAMVDTPLRRQPELVLNISPYRVPDKTKKEIIMALRYHTKNMIDIQVVEMHYRDLSPLVLKKSYSTAILYEYWNWLEVHSENENLKHTQIPEVSFIAPAIMKDSEAVNKLKGLRVFEIIEEHAMPFVGLKLYPISKFSLDFARANEFAEKTKAA